MDEQDQWFIRISGLNIVDDTTANSILVLSAFNVLSLEIAVNFFSAHAKRGEARVQ